jgi:hypothetical protein
MRDDGDSKVTLARNWVDDNWWKEYGERTWIDVGTEQWKSPLSSREKISFSPDRDICPISKSDGGSSAEICQNFWLRNGYLDEQQLWDQEQTLDACAGNWRASLVNFFAFCTFTVPILPILARWANLHSGRQFKETPESSNYQRS